MKKITFLSIDLQKDFSAQGGICYKPRPSVEFIRSTLVPFLKEKKIRIAEIISDYRQPRPGDRGDCCHPGEWGYESEIPEDVKDPRVWIKCMNSPLWVRTNGGDKNKEPGLPYQNTEAFSNWLNDVIGSPQNTEIVLIGLTTDCCVLSTAQELNWRGYDVKILSEGTDTYSGDQKEKEHIFNNPPLTNWAEKISWEELRSKLK